MASIILFSTLWGFGLGEWISSNRRTRALVWIGITTLVSATIVIGGANYLDSREPAQAARSNNLRTDHLLVRYSDSGGNRARFAVENRRDNVESAW